MPSQKNKDSSEPNTSSLELSLDQIKTFEPETDGYPVADAGPDSPKGVEYEERVVAFVDILGFKEIIRRSADDPELVRRIFSALDVRKDDWATMYAAEVGIQKTPDAFDDRFHSFSDFIVMSVRNNIDEIGLLVYGIFKVCRQLLGQGFASRGGVAVGPLYHRDDTDGKAKDSIAPSMVFGPAFIEAYQFESSHADGPRVILQNKVWRTIDDFCRADPSQKLSKFLRTHIQRASDGPAFINLFADFGTNEFYDKKRNLETEIENIYRHICTSLDNTTDKPHFFKKNAQLARAFNKAVTKAELHQFVIPGSKLPDFES